MVTETSLSNPANHRRPWRGLPRLVLPSLRITPAPELVALPNPGFQAGIHDPSRLQGTRSLGPGWLQGDAVSKP